MWMSFDWTDDMIANNINKHQKTNEKRRNRPLQKQYIFYQGLEDPSLLRYAVTYITPLIRGEIEEANYQKFYETIFQ